MNKEQIEQAAKVYADLVTDNKTDWEKAYKHYLNGLQSDAAAAYHGQGWVSVEEMGNFAEWVRCNYIKVAQGYMYRLASIGSSATKYFQMSDLIKMYLMKPLPSPLNEKK